MSLKYRFRTVLAREKVNICILALLAFELATGCVSPVQTVTSENSPNLRPATASSMPVAIDGTQLEITSRTTVVEAGEPVSIKYRITNLSDQNIICGFSSEVLPGIQITGKSPYGDPVSFTEYSKTKSLLAALSNSNTVHPNRSFEDSILLSRIIDMTVAGRYELEFSVQAFTFSGGRVSSPAQKMIVDVHERRE